MKLISRIAASRDLVDFNDCGKLSLKMFIDNAYREVGYIPWSGECCRN